MQDAGLPAVYVLKTVPVRATPDEDPEEASADSNKLTVEIPLKLVDEATLANLDRIIEGKGNLIRKAIGEEEVVRLWRETLGSGHCRNANL